MLITLLLFLVPSGIDFVSGFTSGLDTFKSGMEAGREVLSSERSQHFFVTLEPFDHNGAVRSFADGVTFKTFDASGELAVPLSAGGGWVEAVTLLLSFVLTVALVIFLVQLVRFAVRLPRRRIMAEGNIRSLRGIAWALGALGLTSYGIVLLQFFWLRSHVALEGYGVALDTPPSSLIVALILLAMTEILKLVGRLQHEQDLTI